jgi:hypothetical protein
MGTRLDDRPSLQGLDLGVTGKSQHSSQGAKGSQAGATAPRETSSRRMKSK